MGIVNVTPDSFSDAGHSLDPSAAFDHAQSLIADGADIIDIGAESTRPGSHPVHPDEQLRRVLPLLQRCHNLPAILSIDTTRAPVARAALDAGFHIVNDISAARDDPQMLPLVASTGSSIILMHMLGTPATMQQSPTYNDVVHEVATFLNGRRAAALNAGIAPHNILFDPGIGFGKTANHNLQLLNRLPELGSLGQPLVIGTSRKGFIANITGETDPAQRLFGTAATIAWSIANRAQVVRVHDVAEMSRVVRMIHAILLQHTPEKSKV